MHIRDEIWSRRLSVGIPESRDRVEGLGENESRILKWITKKWGRRICTGFVWLRLEGRGGLL